MARSQELRNPYQLREIQGKRIIKVELRPFQDGRGGRATDPVIYLEGGSRLTFEVQETEGEYGIAICVHQGEEVLRRA